MTTLADLPLLFEYNEWAHHSLVRAATDLSPEELVREMGASFGSVRTTLLHIVAVNAPTKHRCSFSTSARNASSASTVRRPAAAVPGTRL